MRIVKYKTYWAYAGKGVPCEEVLAEFILDVPYLLSTHAGVIPPLHCLNEFLKTGGHNGGMGPGATWKPFQIDEVEYGELVDVLTKMNFESIREKHPYFRFNAAFVDEDLQDCKSHADWLGRVREKYQVK
ncbi:MAG: hypothetical protein DPW16_19640 [Chloroflexi bacterium]|nr:hypothetical protein [Chloroflexota bacterium]